MTIIHQGIRRRTTDVTDDYGQAYYAQNLRFRRVGEIGRRGGIGKTDMAQQAGPVLLIACGSYYETYVAQVVGGTVVTTLNPLAKWADPIIIKPTGVAGACAAWGALSATGTSVGGASTFALPANACPGTITVTGTENPGAPRGDEYGYSFVVTADGIQILSSGCLVSASTFAAIPPGTLSLTVTVTVACAFGSMPGTWTAALTQP